MAPFYITVGILKKKVHWYCMPHTFKGQGEWSKYVNLFFLRELNRSKDDPGVTKQVLHLTFLGKYSNIKNELFKKEIEMLLNTMLKSPLIFTTTAVRRLINTNFVDTLLRRTVLQVFCTRQKNKLSCDQIYLESTTIGVSHKFRCHMSKSNALFDTVLLYI